MIQQSEWKYFLYSLAFALIFFTVAIPFIIKQGITESSPYILFILFNVGLGVFLQFYLKATSLNQKLDFKEVAKTMAIFIALDIWIPPLLVNLTGELSNQPILSASASDYLMGFIAQSLGLKGFLIYLFTYVLAPSLILLIPMFMRGNAIKRL